MFMIKRFIYLTLTPVVLWGCMPQQASIEYSDYYAHTTDDNRAVQVTGEAMGTRDVLGALSGKLGAPDQYDVVTATNVIFIRDLDDLNEPSYDRYALRVADNMNIESNAKENLPMNIKIEDILLQYPHSFVAVNKQDHVIAVARDRLEAQALAQRTPRVFYVQKGMTLQETINRWAVQSGWEMHWTVGRDYTMVAPAVVYGEFSAQGGSLDQLLSTLKNADQPLKAQFSRNGVVVIRPNEFGSSIMAVMP